MSCLLLLLLLAIPSLLAILISIVLSLDAGMCGALILVFNGLFLFIGLLVDNDPPSSKRRNYDPEHNIDDFVEEYGPIDWWHESLHAEDSAQDHSGSDPSVSDRDDRDDWYDRDNG